MSKHFRNGHIGLRPRAILADLYRKVVLNNRPLVLYHGGCKDGFCAAWVANKFFNGEVELMAVNYGTEPPDVLHRDVYILDFSYKRPVLEEMARDVKNITILDHHETAQDDLSDFPGAYFDMHRSGAALTWDWFFPGEKRPWIVDYVMDRDLWTWILPDSREVNAYLQTLPYNLEAWGKCWMEGELKAAQIGSELIRIVRDRNDSIMNIQMYTIQIGEFTMPCINAPTEGISELMEQMMERTGSPISFAWRTRLDGSIAASLRSIKGGPRVNDLAKSFGGGGHPNSAGFEVSGHDRVTSFLNNVHFLWRKV